jgi:hypothetical protein
MAKKDPLINTGNPFLDGIMVFFLVIIFLLLMFAVMVYTLIKSSGKPIERKTCIMNWSGVFNLPSRRNT